MVLVDGLHVVQIVLKHAQMENMEIQELMHAQVVTITVQLVKKKELSV